MKFLLLLLAVVLVIGWLTRTKKPSGPHQASAPPPAGNPSLGSEQMIRCAHCGTYVPASEAVSDGAGALFCSAEHRRLGKVRS